MIIDAATLDEPVDVPLMPPKAWFDETPGRSSNPMVNGFDPRDGLIQIAVDGPEAGRFVALVAPEGEHILRDDIDFQTPMSPTGYEFAHAGTTLTAEGEKVRTANIGGNINHAPSNFPMKAAIDLYANTATRTMRCRYHDVPGVGCVAVGALWPGVTKRDAITAMGMAISGDWRHVHSIRDRDLAGSQLVNAPALRPLPHGVDRHPAYRPMLFRPVAASLGGAPDDVVFGEWVPADSLTIGGHTHDERAEGEQSGGLLPELVQRMARIEAVVAVLILDEMNDERMPRERHEDDDGPDGDGDYDDIIQSVFGCKACGGHHGPCPRCKGSGIEPYDPMMDVGFDMADEFDDEPEAITASLSDAEAGAIW